MATNPNKPKRHHHVLPELYLKGFVIMSGQPFIWVYKRGEPYNPGNGKVTNNPYKESIRLAGAERDFYAAPKTSGHRDFESVENRLEKLEKPANPIFQKLRRHEGISPAEQTAFARYIILMYRRVSAGRQTIRRLLPECAASYEPPSHLFERLNLPDTPELRQQLKDTMEAIAHKEGTDIEAHNAITTAASDSLLVEVLQHMKWTFYTAPKYVAFLTGDSPVFICQQYGLGKNVSELSFPISSDVALLASWTGGNRKCFVKADHDIVEELNRRTISVSSRYAYAGFNADWIVNVFNKRRYTYRPLHQHKDLYDMVTLETDKPEGPPGLIWC